MFYCRPISEFSLFDEFKPGELKIVDWLRENWPEGNNDLSSEILKIARNTTTMEKNSKVRFNADWLLDGLFAETVCDFCGEYKYDDLVQLIYHNEQELDIIFKTLVEHNFIRTDNFMQSVFLAFIMREEHFPNDEDKFIEIYKQEYILPSCAFFEEEFFDLGYDYEELYRTIKPMTNDDIEKILCLLQDLLPPSQYQIMAFYLTEEWKKNHKYTTAERETIATAISNIQDKSIYEHPIRHRRSDIETMINEIMDNTLF